MIWIILTVAAPFLAYICWYAKGNGLIALAISAGIAAVFINCTFAYGIAYISVVSALHLLVLLSVLVILRKPVKEMIFIFGNFQFVGRRAVYRQ